MWISEFYPSSAVSFLAGLLWQNGSIALLYRTILMFLARSCNFDLLPCSVLFGFTLFCLFSIFCTFDCSCLVVLFWMFPAWSSHGFHHFDFPCLSPFLFRWIPLLGSSFLDFLVCLFFPFWMDFLAWLFLFGFPCLFFPFWMDFLAWLFLFGFPCWICFFLFPFDLLGLAVPFWICLSSLSHFDLSLGRFFGYTLLVYLNFIFLFWSLRLNLTGSFVPL